MASITYLVDLSGESFSDPTTRTKWFQAFPAGKYKHPEYGILNITLERLQRMLSGIKNRVRGTDLDIDYDHKAESGKAAGWVTDAKLESDALWLNVEFTEAAYEALQKKEYRYFSPEFLDSWTNPVTNVTHKDVLFGGALTNRPFLKNIQPIAFMESQEGEQVEEFLKLLRAAWGLSEDATEEQILAHAEILVTAPKPDSDKPDPDDDGTGDQEPEPEPELAALMEKSPAVKALFEGMNKRIKTVETQNSTLAKANKLAEVKLQVRNLNEGKYAFSPVQLNEAEAVLVELSEDTSKKLLKLLQDIAKTGVIKMGETGHTGPGNSTERNVGEVVNDRVKALTDKGMSEADAYGEVFQDTVLFEEYRNATFIKEDSV